MNICVISIVRRKLLFQKGQFWNCQYIFYESLKILCLKWKKKRILLGETDLNVNMTVISFKLKFYTFITNTCMWAKPHNKASQKLAILTIAPRIFKRLFGIASMPFAVALLVLFWLWFSGWTVCIRSFTVRLFSYPYTVWFFGIEIVEPVIKNKSSKCNWIFTFVLSGWDVVSLRGSRFF